MSTSARTIDRSTRSGAGWRRPSMNEPSIFSMCTGSLRSQAKLE